MGHLYKVVCTSCNYEGSVGEGTTRRMVNCRFTVACDECYNIENRSYNYPQDRAEMPAPATGWWGRKKRQREIDERYNQQQAEWTKELNRNRGQALQEPCNKCSQKVHLVNFGNPFVEPIPLGIGCPVCKQFGCMTVSLKGMYD